MVKKYTPLLYATMVSLLTKSLPAHIVEYLGGGGCGEYVALAKVSLKDAKEPLLLQRYISLWESGPRLDNKVEH